ncbi:MAG: Reverse transcriptase (RNA-dependent DNA polymerase) [Bacteroidetes bacterium ADurb.Bin416]|nr:MAG: Reverse transcriptase (RNA-dependent DNA polymerase) [Bacteroidetes bacterium ADurb.Bin416]
MKNDELLLTDVFRAYYDARKHKRNTLNQLRFEMNLEENLVELYRDILEGRYRVGRSVCFIVNKPVKREIFAADFRDRVVHHLLYNYLSPVFEPVFIDDSYACRKGLGTLKGIERLEHHIRSCTKNFTLPAYVLKLDIQGYFMSINRNSLYCIIERYLVRHASRFDASVSTKGGFNLQLVLYLTREVVFNDPTCGCLVRGSRSDWNGLPPSKSLFHSATGCGLPIGNLTSQLFSNIYLNELDRFIKRTLGVKHYGRYVDDFFLVHPDKWFLLNAEEQIRAFLRDRLDLTLHPKKVYLQETTKGVAYLGAVVKPYRRYMIEKTLRRILQSLRDLNALAGRNRPLSTYKQQRLQAGVNSYIGFLKHFRTYHLRRSILRQSKLASTWHNNSDTMKLATLQ